VSDIMSKKKQVLTDTIMGRLESLDSSKLITEVQSVKAAELCSLFLLTQFKLVFLIEVGKHDAIMDIQPSAVDFTNLIRNPQPLFLQIETIWKANK